MKQYLTAIQDRLRKHPTKTVARLASADPTLVRKLRNGVTCNPTADTLSRIWETLDKLEKENE